MPLVALFIFISLSASTAVRADLITHLNSSGRDQGYYSIFYAKEEKQQRNIYHCTAYTDRLNPGPVNRLSCGKRVQVIELRDLLEVLAPHLDSTLFHSLEILKRKELPLLEELHNHFETKLAGSPLGALLKNAEETKKNQAEARELATKALQTFEGPLELLSWIIDSKDHFVLYENRQHNPEQYKLVIRLARDFAEAHYQAKGFECANSSHPNLIQNNGGCTLKTNGVTYAQPESIQDRLIDSLWLDRDIAIARCRNLSAGGFRDWRLPTEKELQAAVDTSNAIGFNPFLYYWTSNTDLNTVIERKYYELGSKVLQSKTTPILTGYDMTYNWFTLQAWFTPKFEYNYESTLETNRKLDAKFYLEKASYRLYRPSLAKSFDIEKYRLLSAEGVLTSNITTVHELMGIYRQYNWGEQSKKVNPLEYVHYQLPPNISKSEIGLLCVRRQEEKR